MSFLSSAALALIPGLLVVPSPPTDADFEKLLMRNDSVTIVSIHTPWDGSGIEVGATAAEPEPEPEPVVLETSPGVASRSFTSVPASSSAIELLQWAADQGGPIQQQANGSVPSDLLCSVPWSPSFQVYCPTLPLLTALNDDYAATFGTNISFASGYRAGFAGRSFHGWGLAIDLNGPGGLLGFGDAQFAWLMENGPNYGWYLPFWAGSGGSNPEPWHWEFGSYYLSSGADFASKAPPVIIRWIKH